MEKDLNCRNCILLSECDFDISPCLYEPHDLLYDDTDVHDLLCEFSDLIEYRREILSQLVDIDNDLPF